jgi:hypothetical protein
MRPCLVAPCPRDRHDPRHGTAPHHSPLTAIASHTHTHIRKHDHTPILIAHTHISKHDPDHTHQSLSHTHISRHDHTPILIARVFSCSALDRLWSWSLSVNLPCVVPYSGPRERRHSWGGNGDSMSDEMLPQEVVRTPPPTQCVSYPGRMSLPFLLPCRHAVVAVDGDRSHPTHVLPRHRG